MVTNPENVQLIQPPITTIGIMFVRLPGGEVMAKNGENGEGEFAFFICQIHHSSSIFDFGISHLTDSNNHHRYHVCQVTCILRHVILCTFWQQLLLA